jgi:hypothetical protein
VQILRSKSEPFFSRKGLTLQAVGVWEGVRLYINVDVIAPLKIRKVLFSHESLKKLSSKILIQSPTSLESLQCFLNPVVDLSRYPLSAPYQLPPASFPVLPGQPRLSTPATDCVL